MSKMNAKLNSFVQDNYADYKSDMFSAFVVKCSTMTRTNGYCAFLTPYVWMFIQSYEKMRKYLYANTTIEALIQFEYSAFEEATVPICTFAFRKGYIPKKGCYLRLTDFRGGMEIQRKKTLEAINNHSCGYYFEQCSDNFAKIPGSPVAYWLSDRFLKMFEEGIPLGKMADSKQGLATADNNRFVRVWNEVEKDRIYFDAKDIQESVASRKKWFPYNKGGEYRKWYGNNEYIVNWENDGFEIRHFVDEKGKLRSRPQNTAFYFKPSGSWSDITSGTNAFRYKPEGNLFDITGMSFFSTDRLYYLIGLCNTKIGTEVLKIVAPTIHCQCGDVANIPVIYDKNKADVVNALVDENISLSKDDWDVFETSWDFKKHPLVKLRMAGAYSWGNNAPAMRIESAYKAWEETCEGRFQKLKANEEELNRIFIDIYGLQDELTPEVEDKDVTVRKADLQRDIKSLLSYAVGCMFGRYSLDVPGLVLAGQPFEEKFVHASNAVTGTGVLGAPGLLRAPGALYLRTEDGVKQCTFAPDVDNVIPITDEEYLEDDIIARLCDWLKVVYGADTLEANLDYIAKALGNKGSTSREVIRNYFVNDFFKDHCQTYSVTGSGKRPIYWLFDSGKQNGFKALVYLHRYTPDTIGTLRVDYLHKMQRVYESEINRMQDMMDHTTNAREAAAASKRKDKLTKQLKECRDYDEKISHLALSRIALDLDDGVKVNYRKLQTAADGKFYEVLADSKNIMVKEKNIK